MLQDHPTIEDLEGFLQDASRRGHSARNAKVLRHLLADCRACHGRLEAAGWPKSRLERLVYLPGGMQEGESGFQQAGTTLGYNYDRAFARAEQAVEEFLAVAPPPALLPVQLLQELDQRPYEAQLSLVEEDERFAVPQLVQPLIERSHAARYTDPETMLHWARLACSISASSSAEVTGNSARLADLRAMAWSQYGTALRVTGRLREADEAMTTANRHLDAGTGDPSLKARLREQMASLHTFQRRFDAANLALAEAAETYRELGETHAFARTLVQEAIASLYAGEAEKAVGLLNQAIPLIDHEGEPHLLLAACHNMVQCYINLDQPEWALSIFAEARDLYKEFGESLILLRASWQEGQLLRDLGHLRSAETALLRARRGFVERGLIYEVAVVCLDLAALYVKLRDIDSVKETVTSTVPIFRALQVDREALASLLQLQQVADQEQRAMELIRFLNARIEPLAKRGLLK
jgi:tetratricopeptide (TPR) repeat protein